MRRYRYGGDTLIFLIRQIVLGKKKKREAPPNSEILLASISALIDFLEISKTSGQAIDETLTASVSATIAFYQSGQEPA